MPLVCLLHRCDGKYLRRTDPAECCKSGDSVPCPTAAAGGLCRQNMEATNGGSVTDMNQKGTK